MTWNLLLALVVGLSLFPASAAWAEVGIVAQLSPTASDNAPPRNAQAVEDVERALDRVGIGHRRVNSSLLSDRTLRPFDVVVLPAVRLNDAGTEALRQFADRGGRWVSYLTSGPPALDLLLDLKPTSAAPVPADLQFILPENRLGMPPRLPVPAGAQPRAVEAGNATHTAGRWNVSFAAVPLVRGPHGYYVNLPPSAAEEHSDALLAMLGDLEPTFWQEALVKGREKALLAIHEASLRWVDLRGRPELTAVQRRRIEGSLQGLRARVPPLENLPSEVEGNRILIAGRVRAAQEVQSAARRLVFQMSASRRGEVRGLWIDSAPRQDWDALMRRVREAGLNAVFFRASSGGTAQYPSDVLSKSDGRTAAKDELAAALEAARKQGLAFHVVRVSFDLEGAPPAFLTRMTSEDRLARDASGKQTGYLNPGDPRNTELEFQAILELVRKYDLDGFQLASVRYPGEPHAGWDYGPVSRREFEKMRSPVERWPEDVIAGARQREYDDWQRDTINRFVQRVAAEIKRIKPHVRVSAAVTADPFEARAAVKQDWAVWLRQGWLDFLVPEDFSPDVEVLSANLDTQMSAVRGRVPLVVGLGRETLLTPSDLLLQVEACREQGAEGFILDGADPDSVEASLAALRAGATAEGTWPGYLAPRAEWTITPAQEVKGLPLTLAAGDRGQIEVKLTNVSPAKLGLKGASSEIRLEDASGRFLGIIGGLNGFGTRKCRFEAPAGRFRPVLRGNMAYSDGTIRPFILRGPLCNGVSPEELAALRAQEAPPVVNGAGRKVAIYAEAAGALPLLDALRAEEALNPFFLYRLQPDHLARADALILPPLRDVSDLSPTAIQALREWVGNGGTLLLLADAVGAQWHPRMFPEVGTGQDLTSSTMLLLAREVGTWKAGEPLGEVARAHLRLTPAPNSEVLLTEAGDPKAVAAARGTVGKGRVILYGAAPGSTGEPVSEPERELLRILLAPR